MNYGGWKLLLIFIQLRPVIQTQERFSGPQRKMWFERVSRRWFWKLALLSLLQNLQTLLKISFCQSIHLFKLRLAWWNLSNQRNQLNFICEKYLCRMCLYFLVFSIFKGTATFDFFKTTFLLIQILSTYNSSPIFKPIRFESTYHKLLHTFCKIQNVAKVCGWNN